MDIIWNRQDRKAAADCIRRIRRIGWSVRTMVRGRTWYVFDALGVIQDAIVLNGGGR